MNNKLLPEFLDYLREVKAINLDYHYSNFLRWRNTKEENKHIFNTINIVSDVYGVSKLSMVSKSRKKAKVDARHCAFYVLKKRFGLTYIEIGRLFGNRDHSTIIHGTDAHLDKYKYDEAYRINSDEVMFRVNKMIKEYNAHESI